MPDTGAVGPRRDSPHGIGAREASSADNPQPVDAGAGLCPCREGREQAMVVLARDAEGTPTVWCDPCIAPLVKALNDGGIATVASCCGHGDRHGTIVLADGRDLRIHPFDEAHYEERQAHG